MKTPEVLLSDVHFGEGPRWHDGELWFSQMLAHRVVRMSANGDVHEVAVLDDDRPSGLGWDRDGRLLIVSMFSRALLRREHDGTLGVCADLTGMSAGIVNDMVVDGNGRAYIGNLGYDWIGGETPKPGTVIMVDGDGSAHEAATGVRGPNAILVSDDGGTLIVAELEASKFSAFDLDPESGKLSNYHLWADVAPFRPDGACLDAEGCVWFGSPGDSVFVRVAEGGEVRERIETPGRRSIACILGGDDGRRLFLCTASHGEQRWFDGTVENTWIEAVDVDAPPRGLAVTDRIVTTNVAAAMTERTCSRA